MGSDERDERAATEGNGTPVPAPGGYGPLSRSAVIALEYAAEAIARDHSVRAGKTALFWHLVSVAGKHIGDAATAPAADVATGQTDNRKD